jgi:hydrogenase maturation protease
MPGDAASASPAIGDMMIDSRTTANAPTVRPADTLVLALGNPLRGDDGIGAAVVESLLAAGAPPGVDVLEGGTPGLETVLLLQGYRRAVVVDAADMGREPGAWVRFTPEEVRLGSGDLHEIGILHAAGLAEALALGDALGVLPPEIVIYGVQPADVGWGPGLSAPVEACIPTVCAAIIRDLAGGAGRL